MNIDQISMRYISMDFSRQTNVNLELFFEFLAENRVFFSKE